MNLIEHMREVWRRLARRRGTQVHPLRELFPALGAGNYPKHKARNLRRAAKRRAAARAK